MIFEQNIRNYFSSDYATKGDYEDLVALYEDGGIDLTVPNELADAFKGYMDSDPGARAAVYANRCEQLLSK